MTRIIDLSAVDEVTAADQIPIYSADNGDARRASMTLISEYVQENITVSDDKVTQYSSPNATGFSVTINSPISNVATSIWLILTPLAGYAAGTIVLPAVATCADKQEILVNSTQAITTLTITASGATVNGAPTTMAANAFFRLRFDAVLFTWYRVG